MKNTRKKTVSVSDTELRNLDWADFSALHLPHLSRLDITNSVIIDILNSDYNDRTVDTWSFDQPGACAVKVRAKTDISDIAEVHWSIVLGELNEAQARNLADYTREIDYPGVVGNGLTSQWFVGRAAELGISFVDVEPQQIFRIDGKPIKPPVPGHARVVTAEDSEILAAWLPAFALESSPYDPIPNEAECERIAREGRYYFWLDNENIVSMAGICRRQAKTAAITGVYTPPPLRGRGYAAAVTAAVVEQIQREKRVASLVTDLRVPAANRAYSRIGFRPIHTALHFHRK